MEMALEDEKKVITDEELALRRIEIDQEHEQKEHEHQDEEEGEREPALTKTDVVPGRKEKEDELAHRKTEMGQELQGGEVKKVRIAPGTNTKSSNNIVLGIIIPIIIILLVGLAVYLFLKRRRAKAMGISMRFRNPSFTIGPEELKSVEVDGGKASAAPAAMGVSTSTPSLGPRSYTMESSKSGTS